MIPERGEGLGFHRLLSPDMADVVTRMN